MRPADPPRRVVALTTLLRRAEGEAAWRPAIAMGSGVLFVALGLSGIGNEAAVAFRAGDLDPQIARYASDQAQAAFANGRVALGSFAVCCGMRLVAQRPETEGHVANFAQGGARAAVLAGQAQVALSQVPTPALVIIQTIDNDSNATATTLSRFTILELPFLRL